MTQTNFTAGSTISSSAINANFDGISDGSDMHYNELSWTTYTPVMTGDGTTPVIGNGTITGRYCQIGTLVIGRIYFKMGSGTTFGSGQCYFSLPLNNSTTDYPTNHHYVGECYMEDFATTGCQGKAYILTTQQNKVYVTAITANTTYSQNAGCTGTVPFTWATNDYMTIEFMYEVDA